MADEQWLSLYTGPSHRCSVFYCRIVLLVDVVEQLLVFGLLAFERSEDVAHDDFDDRHPFLWATSPPSSL